MAHTAAMNATTEAARLTQAIRRPTDFAALVPATIESASLRIPLCGLVQITPIELEPLHIYNNVFDKRSRA
jgi:hypothetical protein